MVVRTLYRSLLLIGIFLSGFVIGGSALYWHQNTKTTTSFEQKQKTFDQATQYIRQLYADTEAITPDSLYHEALDGMVGNLDKNSRFMDPEQFNQVQTDLEQQYGGIGAYVEPAESAVEIVSPIHGTPAFEAGLKPGDLIVAVNGEPVEPETTLKQSVRKMKGEPGTTVDLTVNRAGETFDVTITRKRIKTRSVRSKRFTDDLDIGYLSIERFAARTAKEVAKHLDELNKQGMDALLLDLRNNPGGTLEQAQRVADYWLDDGTIVSIKGRRPDQNQVFSAHSELSQPDYPIAVLTNEGSASGSEIVAGALKDHERAILMGEQTYGKGSVQSVLPLPDGSAMSVTTARYYTPSGRTIEKGIKPHFSIKQDEPDTPTVRQLRKLMNGDTVTRFVRDNPEADSAAIDSFVQKLHNRGMTLDRSYILQQIRRAQLARDGRQMIAHLPSDGQLRRALEKFRTLIREANSSDRSVADTVPATTNEK